MANKQFSGYLRDPLGDYASNDKYRFTHISTTGEVVKGSTSYFNVDSTGFYDFTIEYGNVTIESYSELGKRWINQGTATINADTVATTLPALLNALVPASDPLLLQLQALLEDAESAAGRAEAAADNLGTAAAADLVTSLTDITPNRVTTVGYGGLGPVSLEIQDANEPGNSSFFRAYSAVSNPPISGSFNWAGLRVNGFNSNNGVRFISPLSTVSNQLFFNVKSGGVDNGWVELIHTGNTTVDSNGFIKEASPIVKLFSNSAEFNNECPEGAVYKKESTGDYLVKNTLGLAKQGWYIESPKDANGNVKVYVEFDELENGDIEVKTFKPDYSKGFCGGSEPMDIPEGRWIDLRLEKPEEEIGTAV